MHEAWFADEERVRKMVGLLEELVVWFPNAREVSHLDTLLWHFGLVVVLCRLFFNLFMPHIDIFWFYTSSVLQLTCGICFESFPRGRIKSAACGHPFCSACWAGLFHICLWELRFLHLIHLFFLLWFWMENCKSLGGFGCSKNFVDVVYFILLTLIFLLFLYFPPQFHCL